MLEYTDEQMPSKELFKDVIPVVIDKEYTKKDRIKRLNHQYSRLVGKINYMNRLTSMGRKFGRNSLCPCKSGKKFKHCCIVNHDHNQKKVSALQVAMTKLHSKIERYGLRIGRTGVGS